MQSSSSSYPNSASKPSSSQIKRIAGSTTTTGVTTGATTGTATGTEKEARTRTAIATMINIKLIISLISFSYIQSYRCDLVTHLLKGWAVKRFYETLYIELAPLKKYIPNFPPIPLAQACPGFNPCHGKNEQDRPAAQARTEQKNREGHKREPIACRGQAPGILRHGSVAG